MNQPNDHMKLIKPPIRKDKNLVYKGKKYPIDFSLIKRYSNYFYNNKSNYKLINDIELQPNDFTLSDDAVPAFVACCQSEPFNITDSNVFSLHQLSIQYEVPELNALTSQYISENQKPLIFDSISYKLHNQQSKVKIDLADEEEMIVSNFFDYVNDERLLSLPIQTLYRIVTNERLQINSMDSTNQNLYIEFLFKCLDKYDRGASVLFANLDLESERIDVLMRLLSSNYQNKFDFNFVNPKLIAKNASFLLSEMQKLKIEYSQKISEIETENQKQKDFFISAQKLFDETKDNLLKSNQSLEQRIQKLEEELSNQKTVNENQLMQMQNQLNMFKKIEKVSKIELKSDKEIGIPQSTVTLNASVDQKFDFNDGVEWQVIQEDEGTVEIESKNDKSLTLKFLKPKKVKVVAKALDGSGVTATKEIKTKSLTGTIEINVLSDQTIKGTINVKKEGDATLDTARSKYILNTSSASKIGEESYSDGEKLDQLEKHVTFFKKRGQYFLHVLVVDSDGLSDELVSRALVTNGVQPFCFNYTGSVQSVELGAGSYKLEAWGAQGGSANEQYHGGYGGYSAGTINLKSKTRLFVNVGQSANSVNGGYNGGGSGGTYKSNYTLNSLGGGGASHVGLKSGNLSSFESDCSSSLLIAASGGGGSVDGTDCKSKGHSNYFSTGGNGGGIAGASGTCTAGSKRIATGGTQSAGGKNDYGWPECGSFGQGSSCVNHPGNHLGGGGGSGFYGGGSGGNSGPGGGGSGFINTAKLTDAYMYGFEVQTSSSTETKTFSTTSVSYDPVSKSAKKGDGYVKITPL